jgi:ABC-2 type transport system permease protein
MSTPSNASPESAISPAAEAPAIARATRPFYWSVRRELWEYRSIYLAPLAIAGVIVLGFVFVLAGLPHTMRDAIGLNGEHQRAAMAAPFNIAAALIMAASFIVSFYYALDTLYGERRDRTILFWKSLPVSDLTTVLAKASVLLLVLPAVSFAITVVTETIILLLSSVVLAAHGLSVAAFWAELQPYRTLLMLGYHLVTVHILWYAPIYAWLMLISVWARRAPLLWAVLPPFAIAVFEQIAFHTHYFSDFLTRRFSGGAEAVASGMLDPEMKITPGHFMATPGLWFGSLFAAAFLFVAGRLRRYREPI